MDANNVEKCRVNLINYLTDSFRPITITAYRQVWENLKYQNLLFSANNTKNYQNLDLEILFQTSFIRNSINRHFEPHPLPYLADFLNFQSYNEYYAYPLKQIKEGEENYQENIEKLQNVNLEELFPEKPTNPGILEFMSKVVYPQNHDGAEAPKTSPTEIWTFDSNGNFPTRWITMIADFAFPRIGERKNKSVFIINHENSQTKLESVRENWTKIINSLPDDLVFSICRKIYQMMEHNNIGVKINKTPVYTEEDWENYASNYEYAKYYPEQYARNGTTLKDLLESRKWYAGDCFCYPGTLLFFWKVGERLYDSFMRNLAMEKMKKNNYPMKNCFVIYGSLAASEGGISLYYNDYLPWTEYRSKMVLGGNGRGDIRYNPYKARKDVSFEEIVILAETLRMEGADFEIVNN